MTNGEAEIGQALPRRTIGWIVLTALIVALVLLFGAVLPAEYHRDPLGLGRLTGTAAIWAPEEKVLKPAAAAQAAPSRSYPTPFRSDVIEVPLAAAGDEERGDEIEYKVRMKKGGSYVYSWAVVEPTKAEEFYTEFHGHTLQARDAMTVAYYRKATGTADNGVLTAPFDGVHGWYFQNQSEKPVTVRLKLSGFYELIPDGQPGNEFGLHAKAVNF